MEEEVVFNPAVIVVVLVYVGVCPSAARMYEPRPGATMVDVVLGVRLTAERFPLVTADMC
jgi:hypothetical protein